MNGTLEIILRFTWDLVVLVCTAALAWRGIVPAEMVTAVIGLYAGLYGGAMGIGPRGDKGPTGNQGPPGTLAKVIPAAIVVGIALTVVLR